MLTQSKRHLRQWPVCWKIARLRPRSVTASQLKHASNRMQLVRTSSSISIACRRNLILGVHHTELRLILFWFKILIELERFRNVTSNGPSNVLLQHECTLSAFDASQGHGNKEQLITTSIAWHPHAISIAVTLGVQETTTFCARGGALAIWNLNSETFQPASPHLRLEAECALQSASYHPHVPALVVAGSANGGLYVWNLACDSEDLEVGRSTSSGSDTMHWRSVRSVAWVYSQDEASRNAEHPKAFLICSVGRCA